MPNYLYLLNRIRAFTHWSSAVSGMLLIVLATLSVSSILSVQSAQAQVSNGVTSVTSSKGSVSSSTPKVGMLIKKSIDSMSIKQTIVTEAGKMMNAMKTQDHVIFTKYQHPNVITQLGGRDSAMLFFKKQLDKNKASAQSMTIKPGKVLQLIAKNNQYQCVVEELMEVMVDSSRAASIIPLVGFSMNGKQWTFVDASRGGEAIKSVIPTLDPTLRIPFKYTGLGKSIEQTYSEYKPNYSQPQKPLSKKKSKQKAKRKK
jgi:hypothetical protein